MPDSENIRADFEKAVSDFSATLRDIERSLAGRECAAYSSRQDAVEIVKKWRRAGFIDKYATRGELVDAIIADLKNGANNA